MSRYRKRSEREYSQERIAQAQKKYEIKLKSKRGLFPEKSILDLPFDPCKYGKQIRNLRKTKNLTQSELAEEIGTSAVTLSKMENGSIKQLNIAFLYLLCVVLDTNPYYLLGEAPQADGVPTVDEDGNKNTLMEPIKFYEKPVTELVMELSSMTALVDNTYQKDPKLCKMLVFVLKHSNPEIRERLKDAVQGICAICLETEELAELNAVK